MAYSYYGDSARHDTRHRMADLLGELDNVRSARYHDAVIGSEGGFSCMRLQTLKRSPMRLGAPSPGGLSNRCFFPRRARTVPAAGRIASTQRPKSSSLA